MNPSQRKVKNYHITPRCHGCIFENQDDPTERPCQECIRSEKVQEHLQEIEKLSQLGKSSNIKLSIFLKDCWRSY